MSKVVNSLSEELTFLHSEPDYHFVEQPPYAPNVLNVVCRRLREHNNVVQVNECELPSDRDKDDLHASLKGYRCVLQPRCYPNEHVRSVVESKRSFVQGTRVAFNFPGPELSCRVETTVTFWKLSMHSSMCCRGTNRESLQRSTYGSARKIIVNSPSWGEHDPCSPFGSRRLYDLLSEHLIN